MNNIEQVSTDDHQISVAEGTPAVMYLLACGQNEGQMPVKTLPSYCCIIGQTDIFSRIEFDQASILSSDNTSHSCLMSIESMEITINTYRC